MSTESTGGRRPCVIRMDQPAGAGAFAHGSLHVLSSFLVMVAARRASYLSAGNTITNQRGTTMNRFTPDHRPAAAGNILPRFGTAGVCRQSARMLRRQNRKRRRSSDKVRAATARFKDINVALREGWTVATPCVSGPDTGAMGVHLVMGSRLADGIVSAGQPGSADLRASAGGRDALGRRRVHRDRRRLDCPAPNGSPPALEGNLMNLSASRIATACLRSGSCMSGRGRTIRRATSPTGTRTSPANKQALE